LWTDVSATPYSVVYIGIKSCDELHFMPTAVFNDFP